MNDFKSVIQKFLSEKNYVSPWISSSKQPDALIARASTITTLKKESYLFWEGYENQNIYIVRDGRLRVFYTSLTGNERCLYIIERGGMIGEVSAFDNIVNDVSAYAITDATLYTIHIQDMHHLINHHPALSLSVIDSLSYKIRLLHSQVAYTNKSATTKLAAILLALCAQYGEEHDNKGIYVTNRFTHSDLSILLELNRVTVSKLLAEIQQQGILSYSEGHLVIQKPELLMQYME